jgi:hypothetical protein
MPEIYQIWHESIEYKTNNTLKATTDVYFKLFTMYKGET